MIKKIKLSNVATFTKETEIKNIKKINFIYGTNGSGKTTITRVIANPHNYQCCSLEWENNQMLKTLIYNEYFVREYFYEKDLLSGIYTIGEGAKEIEEKIKENNEKKKKLNDEINSLSNSINKKKEEKSKNFNEFKEKCWKKGYQEHQNYFNDFFTGYRNSKEKFVNKILEEKDNKSELLPFEELKNKYKLIYGTDVQKINELHLINYAEFKELESKQEILRTPIIGKKDVDIASMIERLQNHDWVKQGKEYYDKNYDKEKGVYICPFCQQTTTDSFRKQLEEYFDETFNQNIDLLNNFITEYKRLVESIEESMDDLLKISNEYLDKKKETLTDKISSIKAVISKNKQTLKNKGSNPSQKVEIDLISNSLEEINNIIKKVNEEIKSHNAIIEDRQNVKIKLDTELWKFIVNQLSDEINEYKKQNEDIEKALSSLEKQKKEKTEDLISIDKEISELEKKIKSVKPTVDAINKLLEGFGFRGFRLRTTDDEKHYQIVRNDGSNAKKNLSEGERNFLVFLYFYHLIHGVENPDENINQDKIIVIDDPVSSFDSDVLFIVSTLIRNILENIRKDNGTIKQAFIFTHNAYFYKEVTFISSGESCYNKRKDTHYFILRKKDNISFIEDYETCPIKTSYQLLWDDIKKKDNVDCITIQNSMRRIIEFYFKFLANLNEIELINKFDGIEKNICKSLISWINVGSHEILDDFNVSMTAEQIENYRNVFKRIFEETGHIEHYNMMMKSIVNNS